MSESESILQAIGELHEDVREIRSELFGGGARPGIREEIASLKASRRKIPEGVWKGVGAVLLALATVIGGYAGISKATTTQETGQND